MWPRKSKIHTAWETDKFKGAHKKLLEYFEEQFDYWVKAPSTGIFGSFFDSDLQKMAKDGYLDVNETIITKKHGNKTVQYPEYTYRLSTKGALTLADLRSKRRDILVMSISFAALIVSIVSILL